MEYRYWGFIEGHPAHTSLPKDTHTEAMDALKWSYTGTSSPQLHHLLSNLTASQTAFSQQHAPRPLPSLPKNVKNS